MSSMLVSGPIWMVEMADGQVQIRQSVDCTPHWVHKPILHGVYRCMYWLLVLDTLVHPWWLCERGVLRLRFMTISVMVVMDYLPVHLQGAEMSFRKNFDFRSLRATWAWMWWYLAAKVLHHLLVDPRFQQINHWGGGWTKLCTWKSSVHRWYSHRRYICHSTSPKTVMIDQIISIWYFKQNGESVASSESMQLLLFVPMYMGLSSLRFDAVINRFIFDNFWGEDINWRQWANK